MPRAKRIGCAAVLRRRALFVASEFFVAGATGVNIENTVTYQSFTLLLAFLILSLGPVVFSSMRFSVARRLPAALGTAGQPLHYRVQIKKPDAKHRSGWYFWTIWPIPRAVSGMAGIPHGRKQTCPSRSRRVSQRRQRNRFRLATLKEAEIPAATGK